MKIVHLGKYYPPARGGIETHTQTLAQAQAALGAQVRVVVAQHADAAGRDRTFAPFTRTYTVHDNDGPVSIARIGRLASVARFDVAPGWIYYLRTLARTAPPDIWHLHTPNPPLLLAALALGLKPLVVTHHSDVVRQRFLGQLLRPFEQHLYRRARLILVDSPPYAEGSTALAAHRDRVDALPLGIDLAPFQSPSAAALAERDRLLSSYPGPIWLSVGRLVYYKGYEVGLTALRDVPGTWLIVGTGPMAAEWQRKAQELGVADRVVWLGAVEAEPLLGAYLAATALWFPSRARSEGFGLVQVEAMAAGCPVINTAIPHSGVSWVARHEEAGLTVPVDDPAAFAQAAQRLLNEPGLRDRLSAEAHRQAGKRFDHRLMAQRSLDLYRRALAS